MCLIWKSSLMIFIVFDPGKEIYLWLNYVFLFASIFSVSYLTFLALFFTLHLSFFSCLYLYSCILSLSSLFKISSFLFFFRLIFQSFVLALFFLISLAYFFNLCLFPLFLVMFLSLQAGIACSLDHIITIYVV